MKRAAVLSALLVGIPLPAAAQVEVLMMGLCKKVQDDAARLKCFDAIGRAAEKPAAVTETKIPAEWAVTDSKSPIDDSPQVLAHLASEDGDGSLMIRCKERKIEAAISNTGMFAYERGTVLLRLNDLPAASATWPASQNNKAVFAPNGMAFMGLLPDNGTLFVRVTGHSKSNDMTFKLGEMSGIKERIAAACKAGEKRPAPTAPKATNAK